MQPRFALALTLLVGVTGSAAAEGRITAGLGLGVTHSEEDALAGNEPSNTVGLWGRLKLAGRLSAQLEIARIQTEDGVGVDLRQGSGLLLVDLGKSRFVPIVLVGVGVDNESTEYSDKDFVHAFIGGGVEYRASNGVTIGADVRMGARTTTEPQYKTLPVQEDHPQIIASEAPSRLTEGEYRSARLTVGIRF